MSARHEKSFGFSLRTQYLLFALTVFLGGAAIGRAAQFQNYVTFPYGADGVAIGDLNNDGRNDVAISGGNTTYVFLQNAAGGLNTPVAYSTPFPYAGYKGDIAIGDVDNDGLNDLVVATLSGVGVLYQNASASLDPMVVYPSAHSSFSNVLHLRLGDFNDDGLLDVASIDWGTQSQDVDVYLQQADGSLGHPATYTVAHGGYDDMKTGDLNGDGRDDIVVMSGQGLGQSLGVLLQNSTGGFNAPVYYSTGTGGGIGVGDLNGDLFDDVALSYGGNRPGSRLGVLLQNSAGGLNPMTSYASYDIPGATEVADIDQDGLQDAVVVHDGWNALGFFRQSGGSLLTEELSSIPYASSYNPHGMAVGDINGDGLNDVAIADYNHGLVVLYHLASATAKPLVTVKATTLTAYKPTGDPGVFAITRSKVSSSPLTVAYRLYGTASNGVDYAFLNGTVTIAAGATSVPLTVTPLATPSAVCPQAVALKIRPSYNYVLGTAIRDTVLIYNLPTATAQTLTTLEDTASGITLAGVSCDGASLTFTVLTQPAHGTLSGTAPALTYTPAGNYNGADGFTFKVNDGTADSAPATVSITVTPVNDPPSAIPQDVSTREDTAGAITLGGSDVDGGALTYLIVTSPGHGTLSGTAPNLTYTPAANYNGPDSFTFTASDSQITSATARVSIDVAPVNDAPTFTLSSTSLTVKKNSGTNQKAGWTTNISPGPSNESGQTVSFIVSNNNTSLFATQPAINASGTLTFATAKNQRGTATVTVVAQDNGGTTNGGSDRSASKTFSITIR